MPNSDVSHLLEAFGQLFSAVNAKAGSGCTASPRPASAVLGLDSMGLLGHTSNFESLADKMVHALSAQYALVYYYGGNVS